MARPCRGCSASPRTSSPRPSAGTASRHGRGRGSACRSTWRPTTGYTDAEDLLSPRRALARELALLADHERQALELRVVEGLPYEQIARRLAIRPAAARLRVSRALRRLALSVPKEDL
jgi:DNA-directed RNA polymerase specialized sigma24 family protein